MKFLLDTNAVIALLKGDQNFVARLKEHLPEDFGLSAIVLHELFYGAFKSQHVAANLERVEELRFETIEFDREDARSAGEIRGQLAKAGLPIGPYDVLIAGQARARDLTLVTHNVREFQRVVGLRMERW
ncbi:type II toxin-antitoxin system VapC family toxin [Rhizobium sp. LC145]|uniref:type II toxin-antitoxin system VapC family toxin n=1 Tax=Rhizobium sp. LC145 TaxID=1120688 RepID=UPI00062A3025|nr:type II toxin-antitoxin system VapC family toxin [Rhizobium sp. LC145]KKX30292.1 pilus assembly protein [Rhizobium sp. LC145]TKT56831.1 type II toxin-antitoxin system VapC family toxin [Rhizobiaceae bacterium LC148]